MKRTRDDMEHEVRGLAEFCPDDFADRVMARIERRELPGVPLVRMLLSLVFLEVLVIGYGGQGSRALSVVCQWAEKLAYAVWMDLWGVVGQTVVMVADGMAYTTMPSVPPLWAGLALLMAVAFFVTLLPGWHRANGKQ